MRFRLLCSSFVALAMSSPALATGPEIVRALPNYACMMLKATAKQSMDPSFHILYRKAPSDQAPIAGYAMMELAVRKNATPVNGYLAALFPTGANVWVKASEVTPYHNLSNSYLHCIPVVMSNGRVGFDFR